MNGALQLTETNERDAGVLLSFACGLLRRASCVSVALSVGNPAACDSREQEINNNLVLCALCTVRLCTAAAGRCNFWRFAAGAYK